MNNVSEIDKVKYLDADNLKLGLKDRLHYVQRNLKIYSVVTYLIFREIFFFVINIFRPSRPKVVNGQLCLVTGGANGLGRHIAKQFAQEGCNIAIVDIVDPSQTVAEIEGNFNITCKGFKCDISDNNSILKLKAQVEVSMGPVDILVNNAGLLFMSPLSHCDVASIDKCVGVNLTAHFKMVKAFLPGMIERKRGRIVAISSMAAKMSLPLATIYTATKYGVDGFMDSLFDELCLDNFEYFIKLTTVYPYFINTRKDLGDLMDEIDDCVPRMSPEFVAKKIIQGVLLNKRKITITPLIFHPIVKFFPDRIIKYMKTSTTKMRDFKNNNYEGNEVSKSPVHEATQ